MSTLPPNHVSTSFVVRIACRTVLATSVLLGLACDLDSEFQLEGDARPARADTEPRSSQPSHCGNGVIEGFERCDDGNLGDDDGCDATCQPSGIAQMSMGDSTTCAVTLAGNVKCWGRNDRGQLGRGDTTDIGDDELLDTVSFIDLGGTAQQIYTNGAQTLALMTDGTVRGWGRNSDFELGLLHPIDIGDDETPAQAATSTDPIIGGEVMQLALGRDFTCARLHDGAVRCWGSNDFGQLGYGHSETIGDDENPMDAGDVELGGSAIDLAAGAHHVCALLAGGVLTCWGQGGEGQLGYEGLESLGQEQSPVDAGHVDMGRPVVQVVAGNHHTCARLDDDSIRCWGDDERGQLGYGPINTPEGAVPSTRGAVSLGGPAIDLAAGGDHTCAVLETGQIRCWGANDVGQLGLGHNDDIGDDETPQDVCPVDLGPSTRVEAIFIGTGARSTCARLEGGAMRCWGGNDYGQLGYGHTLVLGDEPAEAPGNLPDIVILDGDDDS